MAAPDPRLTAWLPFTTAYQAALDAACPGHVTVSTRVDAADIVWEVYLHHPGAPAAPPLLVSERRTGVAVVAGIDPRLQAEAAAAIASGGPLSRVRLALEAWEAGADPALVLADDTDRRRQEALAQLAGTALDFRARGYAWPPEWAARTAAYLGVPVPEPTPEAVARHGVALGLAPPPGGEAP